MSLIHYFSLDLPLDAKDEDIRKRYIELVKKYTPEKHPEKFQKITSAYEAINNERKRINEDLFGGFKAPDCRKALLSLINAKQVKKRRASLKELLHLSLKK